MPVALNYGVPSVDAFWSLTFRQFEAYRKAFETKREASIKEYDYQSWLNGIYTLSAVKTVVAQALGDKTAHYFDEPLIRDNTVTQETIVDAEEEVELTPEERKRKAEELFMRLHTATANIQLINLRKKLEERKSNV